MIIYVKHPITPEQKAELSKKGKIVDAKFAQQDAEVLNADGTSTKPKPKRKPKVKAE
jgi:hypothetical protein